MQVVLTDFRKKTQRVSLERKHCLFCTGCKMEGFNKLSTLGGKKKKNVYIEICMKPPK